MEAFTMLKYWRPSSGGPAGSSTTTTVVSTAADTLAATESPYSSEGEDGPFFDLEFPHPDCQDSDADEDPPVNHEDETESESEEISVHENDDEDEDEEEELKFALASNECSEQSAAALSPSDELFFKGDLVSIEPSSILLNGSSEENSKLPVFLVKSATKFRVLLLKLKKSKSINGENNLEKSEKDDNNQCKFMAVKFKVDGGPLASLFTRDNSSKENGRAGANNNNNNNVSELTDERKLTKEAVQKYLKMVKPFYVRVSKRYVEKLKFPGTLGFPGGGGGGSKGCAAASAPLPAAEGVPVVARGNPKAHNLQAGLKVVRKHLGKSRSASAAVAAPPPPKAASNRRDDSLLQLQDGIQGAIMHCKKSFNACRDAESSSILCRSVSDPTYEKSVSPTAVLAASCSSSSTSSFCEEAKETTV
ncbi:hypothetical protein CASFOL_020172 [Castilleja foliolosa]|uniref:Membrane-associated kinase regulator 2 n=1 Tax=Castilleja foliolosa TaxID=1961234 RepID=A0ABD3D037_9LAMI